MSGKSTYEWWIDFTISLFHSCSREKRYLLERGCTHRRPITDPSPFSTPPFLSSFFVQERKDILYPPSPTLQKWVANRPMSDESISLFLSYILAQERKHTFLREGALIADPSPTHPLLAHHHFSLPFLFKREKISYIHHLRHSRNESQIDLWVANRPMSYEHTFKEEIYSLIVHGFDFSDQRPYFTTTHLETTTTWYFISHGTSHFQHSARHHPHPLLQQSTFLPRPSFSSLHFHFFHSTCWEKKTTY